VLFVTQLLGLALGLSSKELGLEALAVSPDSLLGQRSIGAAAGTGWTS
jgi:heterodisulfide reductase subunit B